MTQTPSTCSTCGLPFLNNQTSHPHGPVAISDLRPSAPLAYKDAKQPAPAWDDNGAGTDAAAKALYEKIKGKQ